MKALADCTRSHPWSFSDSGISRHLNMSGTCTFFCDSSRRAWTIEALPLLVRWVLLASLLVFDQITPLRPLWLVAMLTDQLRSFLITTEIVLAYRLVFGQICLCRRLWLVAMLTDQLRSFLITTEIVLA